VSIPREDLPAMALSVETEGLGIEAGLQFPVYRDAGPLYPRERYRFAINFAYFF
jgi:hypothetical protein